VSDLQLDQTSNNVPEGLHRTGLHPDTLGDTVWLKTYCWGLDARSPRNERSASQGKSYFWLRRGIFLGTMLHRKTPIG